MTTGARSSPLDKRILKWVRRRMAGGGRRVAGMWASLVERGGGQARGVRPGNIVWIFGSARTGSTWLSRMMEELEGHAVWREPLIGALFGNLYYVRAPHRRGGNFVLGGERETWLPAVRTFVLQIVRLKRPDVKGDGYLVIKEPNGSIGAPLLMEALPESRMILLVRDPRDVAASQLDTSGEDSWRNRNLLEKLGEGRPGRPPDTVVEEAANGFAQSMDKAKQAYDAHKGRKVLVRYEELRADAVGTMCRIHSSLEIPVNDEALRRAVEKHSWENIPEDDKGEGKFYRKATPGGWRDDLTPKQVEIVERVTAPLLDEFYPDDPR